MKLDTKKIATLFLLLSILIGYVPYWAPYYFNLLGTSKITVLGTLKNFETSCPSESNCVISYLIPKNLFPKEENHISIALGEIIGGVSFGCRENGKFEPINESLSYSEPTTLHVYRTVPLNLFRSCTDSGEIRDHGLMGEGGRGFYKGGSLFYGNKNRIESIKRFIEFFLLLLPQMLGLAGLGFYLAIRSLSKILNFSQSRRNFFNLIPLWFITFLFGSGFVATLVPIENQFYLYPRIGGYASNLAFFLTGAYFAQRQNTSVYLVNAFSKISQGLIKSKFRLFDVLLSPVSLVILLGVISPYFSIFFRCLNFLIIIIYLIIGFRNFEFMCLAIAYFLSVLKVVNVLYAPAGNTVFFFVAFYFVYETYLIIQFELNAYLIHLVRNSKNVSNTAKQIVHDIRSPIAALKMILTQSDWSNSSTENHEIVLRAINRVSEISKDALESSKSQATFINTDIKKVCEEICSEIVSLPNVKLQTRVRNLRNESHYKIRFSQIDFYRVLGNLIANASQANGASYLSIEIDRVPSGDIVITIENNGDPIPSDILSEIMLKGGTYNKKDGTGLGLVYCRETIAKFGGEFYLSSEGNQTRAVLRIRCG